MNIDMWACSYVNMQTDLGTCLNTDRSACRHVDVQTCRQACMGQVDMQTGRHADMLMCIHADRSNCRHDDIQTRRRAYMQTGRYVALVDVHYDMFVVYNYKNWCKSHNFRTVTAITSNVLYWYYCFRKVTAMMPKICMYLLREKWRTCVSANILRI